jgi:hypothetical protein
MMKLLLILVICASVYAIEEPYSNLKEAIDDGYYYLNVMFRNQTTCNNAEAEYIDDIFLSNYEETLDCSVNYHRRVYNLMNDTLPETIQHVFDIIFQLRYYMYDGGSNCSGLFHITGMGNIYYNNPTITLNELSNMTCEQRIENTNSFGEKSSDIGTTCVPIYQTSYSIFCGNGSEWVNYIAPTPTSTPSSIAPTPTSTPSSIAPTPTSTPTAPPPKNPITDNPISSSDLSPGAIIGIVFGCLGFFLLLGGYFLWRRMTHTEKRVTYTQFQNNGYYS